MYIVSRLFPFLLAILSLSTYTNSEAIEPTLKFERASFKATYIQQDEKLQRVRVTTDAESVKQVGIDKFTISGEDSVAAQASIVDEKGESVSVSQLFLRFLNKRTMEDTFYALRKKGRDMKLDFGLRSEIRKDLKFWQSDASYRVEMIYGDVMLKESGIWVVTDNMTFSDDSAHLFKEKATGVFDFDVSANWDLLPEFEAPVPEKEKRAGAGMIVIALIGVTAPFLLLLRSWSRMGALKIVIPEKGRLDAIGLHLCVFAHVLALSMFWFEWNIVTTWKVLSGLMVPTLVFARGFLRTGDAESR